MKIEEIMTAPVLTCRRDDNLGTAARIMWENDCGAVPVIDDEGHVVGVVTDRDVCMATYTQGRGPQDIPVARAMARIVFSCHPRDSLETAERVMSDRQIRRIPIVDDENHAVGMLSLNDLARYVASARKKNGLKREVTETLAAISQPRPRPRDVERTPAPAARA